MTMPVRFDVFLSHATPDKPLVEELGRRLARENLKPWLDKWNLIPGTPWMPEVEAALAECAACAVIIGPGGFGPWHHEEMQVAISRRVNDRERAFRVIPVLLPLSLVSYFSNRPSYYSTIPSPQGLPEFLARSSGSHTSTRFQVVGQACGYFWGPHQRHSHRPHFHRRTPLRDASLSTHLNHGPAQDRLAPHPLVRLGQRVVDLAVLGTAVDALSPASATVIITS